MGRPKGSKNKKTLLLEQLQQPAVEKSIGKNFDTIIYDDVIVDEFPKQLELDFTEQQLSKVVIIPEQSDIVEAIQKFSPMTGDITERSCKSDTKANPQGKYYQFMHPCNIENPPFKYRFLSVVRDGLSYSSLPFNDREECHKLLKELIEGDTVPVHENLYVN